MERTNKRSKRKTGRRKIQIKNKEKCVCVCVCEFARERECV